MSETKTNPILDVLYQAITNNLYAVENGNVTKNIKWMILTKLAKPQKNWKRFS